jgi:hypothetical protein
MAQAKPRVVATITRSVASEINKTSGSAFQQLEWGRTHPDEFVAKHKGDAIPDDTTYADPGLDELLNSCRSTDEKWRETPVAELYLLVPVKRAPSTLSVPELDRLTRIATRLADEATKSDDYKAMQAILAVAKIKGCPRELLDKAKGPRPEMLLPIEWVCSELEKLHMAPGLIYRARNQLQRYLVSGFDPDNKPLAPAPTQGDMWYECICIRNGQIKTVREMQQHLSPALENAMRHALHTSEFKPESVDELDKAAARATAELAAETIARLKKL